MARNNGRPALPPGAYVLPDKVEAAIDALIDALVGEEPHRLMVGPGAEKQREKRREARTVILQLAFLCRRMGREEGVVEAERRRALIQADGS